jgi:hypothetical protein
MNKEQIYDSQISSLISKIVKICEDNGIAFIASFHIPTEKDKGLCCSTVITDQDGFNGPGHKEAFEYLYGSPIPDNNSEVH